MSMRTVETGLPFFDDINKQARNKPYFNAYLKEWICPKNRLLPFQFAVLVDDATITDFLLHSADTDGVVDNLLTHFLDNATSVARDVTKYWIYNGTFSISLTAGRYYLYAKSTDGEEKWSEVFTVTELEE